MKNIKNANEYAELFNNDKKSKDSSGTDKVIVDQTYTFSDRYNYICNKLKNKKDVSLEDINYSLSEIIKASEDYENKTK
jgi:hypothetical protein